MDDLQRILGLVAGDIGRSRGIVGDLAVLFGGLTVDAPGGLEELALRAPVFCAFAEFADQLGIPTGEAVRPPLALDLAAAVMDALYPWSPSFEEAKVAALRSGEAKVGMIRSMLEDTGTDWWFWPLARDDQEWLGGRPDARPEVHPPAESSTDSRPRLPMDPLFTTTRYRDRTSAEALLACWADGGQAQFPLPRAELPVAESAMVWEIRSPHDWHELAVRYSPTPRRHGEQLLTPRWSEVAEDWDIVHLTFGGFLLATFVPVESPSGSAELRTWKSESSLWLGDVSSGVRPLPPLEARPRPLLGGVRPRIRGVDSAERPYRKRLRRKRT